MEGFATLVAHSIAPQPTKSTALPVRSRHTTAAAEILPLTSLDTLTRWSDAPIPESAVLDAQLQAQHESSAVDSGASSSGSSLSGGGIGGAIQFRVNASLNRKLVLVQSDILGLKVDAIVHSTNERLTDWHTSTLGTRLAAYAGPAFMEECSAIVRHENGVATGDSSLLSSHALGRLHGAARWIILTVSPKYSTRYQTAAENALHGCVRRSLELLLDQGAHSIAFPLITTKRKAYPAEAAAHITFRTLRKFMDRYGEHSLTDVVLCLQEGDDTARDTCTPRVRAVHAEPATDEDELFRLYQHLLPLYFPRTPEEEALQVKHLPRETGNEIGETVVEERRIRIAYGQFIAAGPTPFSPGQRAALAREQQQRATPAATAAAADSFVSSAVVAALAPSSATSSVLPTSTFQPSRTEYVSASDMPREPEHGSSSRAPVLSERVRSDTDAFSVAQEHPDAMRARAYSAALTPEERRQEAEENHTYYRRLKLAQACGHADMTVLDDARYMYESTRVDSLGRRLVHVVGSRVPLFHSNGTPRVSPDHLVDHVVRTLEPIVAHPFTAIYYHTGVDHTNRPDVSWFRRMYQLFPRSHKSNLRQLIIVHPTWYLRAALWIVSSFVANSFWKKIVYVDKLADLQQYIDARSLEIPPHVLQYDRATHGVSPLTSDLRHDDAGL